MTVIAAPSNSKVFVDDPITSTASDLLGRTDIARSFVRRVLRLNASNGVVVGVMGPWGTGKTSFLNLAQNFFEEHQSPVIAFNPWLFSGTEQLVNKLFDELSAELRLRDMSVQSEALKSYGDALAGFDWIPVGGTWFKFFGGIFRLLSSGVKPKGVNSTRKKVGEALRKLEKPFVVAVDDLDRLSTEEIRDVFRLVRLTASFPNIIYVLSFDRSRVERALGEDGLDGRAYLEKILQLGFELPKVPDGVMRSQVLGAIDEATRDLLSIQRFDERRWQDIYFEIIHPLIRHMRDSRRYAAHIEGVVAELNGHIALEDVLAIEAIRVFLPDFHAAIVERPEDFTTTSWISNSKKEKAKQRLELLLERTTNRGRIAECFLSRVFPATNTLFQNMSYGGGPEWKRKRRLADRDMLEFYLTKVEGEAIKVLRNAEKAFEVLSEGHDFIGFLKKLEPSSLEDVISSLEGYESRFTNETLVPGVVALLHVLPLIPDRNRGMLEFDAETTVRRVVFRFLRAVDDQLIRTHLISEAYRRLGDYSSKLTLIKLVGAGHQLAETTEVERLEALWREEIRSLSEEQLVGEANLLDILLVEKFTKKAREVDYLVPSTPRLNYSLLKSAWAENKSQQGDERLITRTPRLRWKPLLDVTGGEEQLRVRVEEARAVAPGSDAILQLADRHLGGWDPDKDE